MTNLGNPQWKLWATPYSSHSIPNIPNLQPQPSSSWPHARGCGCSAVIDQESIGQHPGVADTTRHDESHRAQAWPSVPAAEHGLQDILGGASSFLLASIILLRVVYVVVFGLFKWLMFNQFVSFPYFHNNIQGTRLGEYPTTFGHTLECLQRSQGQNQITRWTDESTTILHIHVQRRLGMLCKSVLCLHYPVKSMCVYFFGVCCSSKFTELQLWFVWFLAGGFPPGEEIETEERLPRRLHGDGPSDRDVFCLVEQFMSDGFEPGPTAGPAQCFEVGIGLLHQDGKPGTSCWSISEPRAHWGAAAHGHWDCWRLSPHGACCDILQDSSGGESKGWTLSPHQVLGAGWQIKCSLVQIQSGWTAPKAKATCPESDFPQGQGSRLNLDWSV